MRKYLQITIVLGIFALFVLIRQAKIEDETPVVGVSNKTLTPTPAAVPTATPLQNTPSPSASSAKPASSFLPSASPQPTPAMIKQQMMGKYKNGTYTGSVEDAYYGNIQVQAVISGGKITDVVFLQYPNDNGTSIYINSQAMPLLKQEAIAAQSAQVDGISGASSTSPAFTASLSNALNQAKN